MGGPALLLLWRAMHPLARLRVDPVMTCRESGPAEAGTVLSLARRAKENEDSCASSPGQERKCVGLKGLRRRKEWAGGGKGPPGARGGRFRLRQSCAPAQAGAQAAMHRRGAARVGASGLRRSTVSLYSLLDRMTVVPRRTGRPDRVGAYDAVAMEREDGACIRVRKAEAAARPYRAHGRRIHRSRLPRIRAPASCPCSSRRPC